MVKAWRVASAASGPRKSSTTSQDTILSTTRGPGNVGAHGASNYVEQQSCLLRKKRGGSSQAQERPISSKKGIASGPAEAASVHEVRTPGQESTIKRARVPRGISIGHFLPPLLPCNLTGQLRRDCNVEQSVGSTKASATLAMALSCSRHSRSYQRVSDDIAA